MAKPVDNHRRTESSDLFLVEIERGLWWPAREINSLENSTIRINSSKLLCELFGRMTDRVRIVELETMLEYSDENILKVSRNNRGNLEFVRALKDAENYKRQMCIRPKKTLKNSSSNDTPPKRNLAKDILERSNSISYQKLSLIDSLSDREARYTEDTITVAADADTKSSIEDSQLKKNLSISEICQKDSSRTQKPVLGFQVIDGKQENDSSTSISSPIEKKRKIAEITPSPVAAGAIAINALSHSDKNETPAKRSSKSSLDNIIKESPIEIVSLLTTPEQKNQVESDNISIQKAIIESISKDSVNVVPTEIVVDETDDENNTLVDFLAGNSKTKRFESIALNQNLSRSTLDRSLSFTQKERRFEKVLDIRVITLHGEQVTKYLVKKIGFSYLHLEWVTAEEICESGLSKDALVGIIQDAEGGDYTGNIVSTKPFDRESYCEVEKFLATAINQDCVLCGTTGSGIACSGCEQYFHLVCASLNQMPKRNWFCEACCRRQDEKGKSPEVVKNMIYYVKWKSLDYEEATWEKKSDLERVCDIDFYVEKLRKIENRVPPPTDRKSFQRLSSPSFCNDQLLRPYQLDGVNTLISNWNVKRSSVLAYESGLGKIITVVAAIDLLFRGGALRQTVLVLAPERKISLWKNEFKLWTDLSVICYQGSSVSRDIIRKFELFQYDENGNVENDRYRCDIVLMSYETTIFNEVVKELEIVQWDIVVMDEAQLVLDHTSQEFISVKELCQNSRMRILLHGGPIQYKPSGLYSLLKLLRPTIYSNWDQFYARNKDLLPSFNGVISEDKATGNLVSLLKMIKSNIILKDLHQVEHEMPQKSELLIEVEMPKFQKDIYLQLLDQNRQNLASDGAPVTFLRPFSVELLKICHHPFLIGDQIVTRFVRQQRKKGSEDSRASQRLMWVECSGKFIFLDKLLAFLTVAAIGARVAIILDSDEVLCAIKEYLSFTDYPFATIDDNANVTSEVIASALSQFNSRDSILFILLLTYSNKTAKINLDQADVVVFFDVNLSLRNAHTRERLHNHIGTKKEVTVYKLITRNTIEAETFYHCIKKNQVYISSVKDLDSLVRKSSYQLFKEDEAKSEKAIFQFLNEEFDSLVKRCGRDMSSVRSNQSTSILRIPVNESGFWTNTLPKCKTQLLNESLAICVEDPSLIVNWLATNWQGLVNIVLNYVHENTVKVIHRRSPAILDLLRKIIKYKDTLSRSGGAEKCKRIRKWIESFDNPQKNQKKPIEKPLDSNAERGNQLLDSKSNHLEFRRKIKRLKKLDSTTRKDAFQNIAEQFSDGWVDVPISFTNGTLGIVLTFDTETRLAFVSNFIENSQSSSHEIHRGDFISAVNGVYVLGYAYHVVTAALLNSKEPRNVTFRRRLMSPTAAVLANSLANSAQQPMPLKFMELLRYLQPGDEWEAHRRSFYHSLSAVMQSLLQDLSMSPVSRDLCLLVVSLCILIIETYLLRYPDFAKEAIQSKEFRVDFLSTVLASHFDYEIDSMEATLNDSRKTSLIESCRKRLRSGVLGTQKNVLEKVITSLQDLFSGIHGTVLYPNLMKRTASDIRKFLKLHPNSIHNITLENKGIEKLLERVIEKERSVWEKELIKEWHNLTNSSWSFAALDSKK